MSIELFGFWKSVSKKNSDSVKGFGISIRFRLFWVNFSALSWPENEPNLLSSFDRISFSAGIIPTQTARAVPNFLRLGSGGAWHQSSKPELLAELVFSFLSFFPELGRSFHRVSLPCESRLNNCIRSEESLAPKCSSDLLRFSGEPRPANIELLLMF